MSWLGLVWDEGPHFQSERTDLYRLALKELVRDGHVYACTCTRQDVEARTRGAAKPGYSSGQALTAMERTSAATLPAGYNFEWTGTALQEKAASGRTGIVLGVAVLFAYLFLFKLGHSTPPCLRRLRQA